MRNQSPVKHRGESNSGLVMFLAGLVVGAILSTIYFGYTSGQTGVGAGLKNLTRNFDDSHANPSPVARQATATLGAVAPSDVEVGADERINTADITSGIAIDSPGDANDSKSVDDVAGATANSEENSDNDFDFYTRLQSGNRVDAAQDVRTAESQLPSSRAATLPDTATMASVPAPGKVIAAVTPDMSAKNKTDAPSSAAAAEVTSLPVAGTALAEANQTDGDGKRAARKGMTRKGQYYMLQLAAFSSYDKADGLKAKLALQGVQALIQRVNDGETVYRVAVGPFIRFQHLDSTEQKLRNMGMSPKKLLMKNTRS
jgi:cell division protein FtsN